MADSVTIRVVAASGNKPSGLVGAGRTADGRAGHLPPAGQSQEQRKLNVETLADDDVGKAAPATVSANDVAKQPVIVDGSRSARARLTNPDGSDRNGATLLKKFAVETKAADAEEAFSEAPKLTSGGASSRAKIDAELPNNSRPRVNVPFVPSGAPTDKFEAIARRNHRDTVRGLVQSLEGADPQADRFAKSNRFNFLRDHKADPLVPWGSGQKIDKGGGGRKDGAGNKKAWLNTTGFTVSNSGAGGARGGYSKIFRNLSAKGQYVKSIFSRALERTGITGMSHLATFSTFGVAVAVPQVASYVGRQLVQEQIEELQREGRIAAKSYRSMKRDEIFRDIAKRGRDLQDAEQMRYTVEKMGEFAPLAALVIMQQSHIQALPWWAKAPAVVVGAVGVSALVGYATSGWAPRPGTAAWATRTVADNITPADLRGGTLKLTADGSVDVEVVVNQGDLRYGALLSNLYKGKSAESVGSDTIAMMAESRGMTSPYDLIRAKAAIAAGPKMGTGTFAASAQAAFKAQSESTEEAERVMMRRLMRNVAKRNSVQEAQAQKVFK